LSTIWKRGTSIEKSAKAWMYETKVTMNVLQLTQCLCSIFLFFYFLLKSPR
jgi:hypothetical protein